MAALSLEVCGFCPKGQAMEFASQGGIGLKGATPISTFGGLKARGHPVGASGVYQLAEVCMQLRNEAGANQVGFHRQGGPIPATRLGMMSSFGGAATTVVTHIVGL